MSNHYGPIGEYIKKHIRVGWRTGRCIFGFRKVGTPDIVRLAILEADMRWVVRGWWVLLAAIILRPFIR